MKEQEVKVVYKVGQGERLPTNEEIFLACVYGKISYHQAMKMVAMLRNYRKSVRRVEA